MVPVSDGLLSIGAFSRASFLSVKMLRAYHEAGILVPARVDPQTGYRSYHSTQLTDAAVIVRLRALDLPLPRVREVVHRLLFRTYPTRPSKQNYIAKYSKILTLKA